MTTRTLYNSIVITRYSEKVLAGKQTIQCLTITVGVPFTAEDAVLFLDMSTT